MNFKIGDRVKQINGDTHSIYTILKIHNEGLFFKESEYWWDSNNFEIIN